MVVKNKHVDKIKSELFKKIREHSDIESKISDIESDSDGELQELLDENEEYGQLCLQKLDLEREIDEYLVDTVYIPLTGLTNKEKKEIDFVRIAHSLEYEKIIENEFDTRLLNFRDDMKRRLRKLQGLYLITEPNERVVRLYKEIIRCYIFDLCDACTALCRALVESVVTEYCMQDKEARKEISSAKKSEKRWILSKILEKKLTKELYKIYSDIGLEGSSVLHWRRSKVNEDEALKIIEDSQKFINEIYKTPDFSHLIEEI